MKIDLLITDEWQILNMSKGLDVATARDILDFYILQKLDGELENQRAWLWEETSPDLPRSRFHKLPNEQAGESVSWSDVNGSD